MLETLTDDSALSVYLRFTAPLKGSKRYHVWAFLSAVSALLERRTWLNLGALGRIYPNQYIVLCGEPGCGKTTASDLVCNLLKTHNKRLRAGDRGVQFCSDKLTPAAMFKQMRETTRTIKVETGEAFEHSSLFVHSTEMSTFIKDIGGGSLSDDLLKFYDCSDRFEKRLAGEDGTITIQGPCLNMLLDTTPSFLSAFLPREESGTGLTARIIFATELGFVDMDEEVPDGDPVLKERLLQHMARIFKMSGSFRLHTEVKDFWKTWFVATRKRLFELPAGSFMKNFYARKPTHVRKIAMVLSACRDSSRVILLEDIKRAIEIIDEAEPLMDKSFGVKDFKKANDAVKVILEVVPWTPGEISEAELIQTLYSNGLSGAIQDFRGIIDTLVSGQMLKPRIVNANVRYFTRLK